MVVTKNTNIVQANSLVEHRPNFTKDETRLFLTIIGAINKDDDDFKPLQIPVSKFASLWGIDSKNAYKTIQNALRGLRNKEFFIENTNPETGKRRFLTSSSISAAIYEEGEGYATVEISKLFKPYLLALKKHYTSYVLKNIMDLSTVTCIRHYELLKQYQYIGKRIFSLEEYKKAINIENKYPVNADLKRYVLEPCIKEINTKTDIFITYNFISRGKNLKIQFDISTNNHSKEKSESINMDKNSNQISLDENISEKKDEREKICCGFGSEIFDEFTIEQLIELKNLAWYKITEEEVKRHSFLDIVVAHQYAVSNYIQQKIIMCNAKKTEINNRYGFIKRAIIENYL